MAGSLTKKYIRMVAQDDASALMAALPQGFDPRDYHIQGDPLPLRCAMYGAASCFMAMAQARPDLAEEIFSMADGGGGRAVDWLGAWADADMVRQAAALAPQACSAPSSKGRWPLGKALAMARWDGAQAWLDLNEQSAKLADGERGAGALRLMAEPSDMFINRFGQGAWSPPPEALARRLAALGADPEPDAKGYSALFRAALFGNLALIEAIAGAFPERSRELLEAGGDFNAGHEAARAGQAGALRSLAAMGLDLASTTARGFGLIHLAIRQGSLDAADALVDLGAPLDPPGGSTSCACSALASSDPLGWLAWAKARGADMDRRDDHGAHWAELAWERLGFEQARDLWTSLGDLIPKRSARAFFGPLERAARSSIDPAPKLRWLLAQGFFPARVELSPAQGVQSPREALESIHEFHDHARSFGAARHLTLGPAWRSEPDPLSSLLDDGGWEDDDDISWNGKKNKPAPRKRPSLLAYCAARGAVDALRELLAWDRQSGFWRPVDRLCAWREALRADAPAAVLSTLHGELGRLGVDPWGPPEIRLALERLGPAKARQLAAPLPGSGQAAQLWMASGARDPFLSLSEKRYESAWLAGSHESADAASQEPWRFAALADSDATLKTVFSASGPWPALCALRCAMSACAAARAPLAMWILKNLAKRTPDAEPGSPWAQHPERAAQLWQDQLAFEMEKAREQFPSLPRRGEPAGGCVGEALILRLFEAGAIEGATELLSARLVAPESFDALGDAIALEASNCTAIGAGSRALERLRSFCQALCEQPQYQGILNRCARPILARLPDPALFDAFLRAGADVGRGRSNAAVALCRGFAGRLSPAFAERLARLAVGCDPSMSLAVASELAAMRPHLSRDWFDFAPTAAARARVERAAKACDPLGWSSSLDNGFCPVASALGASNVRLALDLATSAPQDYRERARGDWMGAWMKGRAGALERAVSRLRMHPRDDERSRERRAEGEGALEAMAGELAELASMGASFGSNPQAESDAFAECAQSDCAAGALLWLLEQGWRPQAPIDAELLSYSARRAVERAFAGEAIPRLVPALCAALGASRDAQAAVGACLAWEGAGLPMRIDADPPKPLLAMLAPEVAAAVEEALLRRDRESAPCAKKAARL